MVRAKVFLFSFILIFAGCKEKLMGNATGANSLSGLNTVGGTRFVAVSETESLLEGSAGNGGRLGHSFNLNFKLVEGSPMTFHMFCDRNLKNGLDITFKRAADVITMVASQNGQTNSYDLEDANYNLDGDILDLFVDVHNDHNDQHFLVWDASHGPNYSGDKKCEALGECIYNSDFWTKNHDHWLGVGYAQGTFWGVTGIRENLISVSGFNDVLFSE